MARRSIDEERWVRTAEVVANPVLNVPSDDDSALCRRGRAETGRRPVSVGGGRRDTLPAVEGRDDRRLSGSDPPALPRAVNAVVIICRRCDVRSRSVRCHLTRRSGLTSRPIMSTITLVLSGL